MGPAGVAQMGATVLLMNRFDQLIHRVSTNERGAFGFDFLPPDVYTVRVNQTSFAPTAKSGLRVGPGERSFLAIQLASMVSSIQLTSTVQGTASLMTDEWKWVLRSGLSTRPVLRFLPSTRPQIRIDDPQVATSRPSFFSDTRGLLSLSAGEIGNAQAASIADMGTAFALSTQVMGASRVMFSGNLGYSPASGVPAAAFQTAYRRDATDENGLNPELRLTVQQVFLPMGGAPGLQGTQAPSVRSMSSALSDRFRISDHIMTELGSSIDSVSFGSRISYLSPYALTTIDLERFGSIELGFSSGIPPMNLYGERRAFGDNSEVGTMHRNVNALALMPRVTLRDGRPRIQRSRNYEIGYRKEFGSRAVTAAFYREDLSNAALTMVSPEGFFPDGDLMPDFNSQSSIFNIGDFSRSGFSASASQQFGDLVSIAMIVSRGGTLRTDQRQLDSQSPDEIRSAVQRSQQNAIATRVSGAIPKVGTSYSASYQWTDYRALTPGHYFLTRMNSVDAGLNLAVRQRVPAPPFLSGRMEITAEMRNLLAQGYLPLTAADGRSLLLIHTPRSVRGGVAFFF